jgi:hypothetical protein
VSNLLYVGIAIAASTLGGIVIYLRNRKPTSLNAGIEEVQRELKALNPERRPEPGRPPVRSVPPSGTTRPK